MNEVVVLTPERILEVTEDVLRRYGLAKATVVDVARALDVSHGSVYRHFPSKASLREAVAKRWLDRLSAPLLKIAEASGPAPARLEKWLRTMFAIKHKRLGDDPEMFATYLTLAREACTGRELPQGLSGRPDCPDPVRRREAGHVRGRRHQGDGARHVRCHQPLPPSRRMPRNGTSRVRPRGSMRCWRCCSRVWKRRARADILL